MSILPALLILSLRTRVQEREQRLRRIGGNPLLLIFGRDLLASGAQGGYYAIFPWLPTFLKTSRHLSLVGSVPYIAIVILGSFLGYVISGYINDWLGRRPTFLIFALSSAFLILEYTSIPVGANALLLILGLSPGFFASGIFRGFASYLAEPFPSRVRGAGQGFVYNVGRGIGVLSGSIGLACAYALCAAWLLFLPETRSLRAVRTANIWRRRNRCHERNTGRY